MAKEIKNIGVSVRARLLNLSKANGQSFDLVLTRFALERLLFRLSQSRYADRFVLKGAMLLMSWFKDPHRGTRDLDLLGFGDLSPSQDPLVVAVHLPPVQIREMIVEDNLVTASKQESVESAAPLYGAIVERLKAEEPDLVGRLAAQLGTEPDDISFLHVAEAIAGFIRQEFALKVTKFHRFVFSEGSLSSEELRGGIIFYGKGKCAVCHSGPYLSDLSFHSVPMGQLGYGINGFGVDYGRYNVTHDPDEIYRFRTPPLFNVEKTAPYGHSGAVASLEEAVIHHFDPLRDFKVEDTDPLQRHEIYKSIAASGDSILQVGYLDDEEVRAVVAFLRTLSF